MRSLFILLSALYVVAARIELQDVTNRFRRSTGCTGCACSNENCPVGNYSTADTMEKTCNISTTYYYCSIQYVHICPSGVSSLSDLRNTLISVCSEFGFTAEDPATLMTTTQSAYMSTTSSYPSMTNYWGTPDYYWTTTSYPYHWETTSYPYHWETTSYPSYWGTTSYPYKTDFSTATNYPYYWTTTSYPYHWETTSYPHHWETTSYPSYWGTTSYPHHWGTTSYPHHWETTSYPHYWATTSYPYATDYWGTTSYPYATDYWGTTSYPYATDYWGTTSYPYKTDFSTATNYPYYWTTTSYPDTTHGEVFCSHGDMTKCASIVSTDTCSMYRSQISCLEKLVPYCPSLKSSVEDSWKVVETLCGTQSDVSETATGNSQDGRGPSSLLALIAGALQEARETVHDAEESEQAIQDILEVMN